MEMFKYFPLLLWMFPAYLQQTVIFAAFVDPKMAGSGTNEMLFGEEPTSLPEMFSMFKRLMKIHQTLNLQSVASQMKSRIKAANIIHLNSIADKNGNAHQVRDWSKVSREIFREPRDKNPALSGNLNKFETSAAKTIKSQNYIENANTIIPRFIEKSRVQDTSSKIKYNVQTHAIPRPYTGQNSQKVDTNWRTRTDIQTMYTPSRNTNVDASVKNLIDSNQIQNDRLNEQITNTPLALYLTGKNAETSKSNVKVNTYRPTSPQKKNMFFNNDLKSNKGPMVQTESNKFGHIRQNLRKYQITPVTFKNNSQDNLQDNLNQQNSESWTFSKPVINNKNSDVRKLSGSKNTKVSRDWFYTTTTPKTSDAFRSMTRSNNLATRKQRVSTSPNSSSAKNSKQDLGMTFRSYLLDQAKRMSELNRGTTKASRRLENEGTPVTAKLNSAIAHNTPSLMAFGTFSNMWGTQAPTVNNRTQTTKVKTPNLDISVPKKKYFKSITRVPNLPETFVDKLSSRNLKNIKSGGNSLTPDRNSFVNNVNSLVGSGNNFTRDRNRFIGNGNNLFDSGNKFPQRRKSFARDKNNFTRDRNSSTRSKNSFIRNGSNSGNGFTRGGGNSISVNSVSGVKYNPSSVWGKTFSTNRKNSGSLTNNFPQRHSGKRGIISNMLPMSKQGKHNNVGQARKSRIINNAPFIGRRGVISDFQQHGKGGVVNNVNNINIDNKGPTMNSQMSVFTNNDLQDMTGFYPEFIEYVVRGVSGSLFMESSEMITSNIQHVSNEASNVDVFIENNRYSIRNGLAISVGENCWFGAASDFPQFIQATKNVTRDAHAKTFVTGNPQTIYAIEARTLNQEVFSKLVPEISEHMACEGKTISYIQPYTKSGPVVSLYNQGCYELAAAKFCILPKHTGFGQIPLQMPPMF